MAHLHLKNVADGQWRLAPQRDSQLSSGILQELGPKETPPPGFFRRLGWRCRMLGRRVWAEVKLEWPLLKPRLWVIIPCLIFQYIHAIFTGMAYYMHEPLPLDNTTLHDLGFEALPFLSNDAVSEILVYCGFAMFFVWALSPFVTRRKSFHFVVVLKRALVVVVLCQILRIVSFLSTQLPAPAPHCRAPEPTSNAPWPVWWQVIIVNVARQASKGCGDLIFSSHLTFMFLFAWTYAVMGRYLLIKIFWFLYVIATSLCIIASRKHYTVDCVVAFYVVPLVFFHFCRKWTTTRDDICTNDNRGIVALGSSLPMTAVPSHSRGASLADAAMAAAANGNGYADSGSKYGLDGSQGEEAGGAAGTLGGGGASWQQRPGSAAAALGAAGSGPAEVRLDVEMAARVSSAPILAEAERPPSPVKQAAQAAQQAWNTISGLPRRMASGGPAHRRTESQEPVLLMEDKSTGSV